METHGSYFSLFERLGVNRGADSSEIETAWKMWFLRSGGSHHDIPADVREAYRLLSVPESRKSYRDLLELCDSGDVLDLGQHEIEALRKICESFNLSLWNNPYKPREFMVLHPHQSPPVWTVPVEPGQFRPKPPPTWWERILDENHFKMTMTVLVTSVAVIALLIFGITSAIGTFRSHQNQNAHAAFLADTTESSKILENIRREKTGLIDDFRKVTGGDPVENKWRDDINPIMLTHPEFRAAWHEFATSLPSEDSLSNFDARLRTETQMPAEQVPGDSDIVTAKHLTEDLDAVEKSLAKQHSNLKFIKGVIEADNFSRGLDHTERKR